ncbi:MAG: hypothetical protein M0R06_16690 [Sphaerochaeta sp.]|nr:hypothetical protein [Sphaerochaeta sp.]
MAPDAKYATVSPMWRGCGTQSVLMNLKVDTAGQIIVMQKCERSPNVGLPPYKVLCLG